MTTQDQTQVVAEAATAAEHARHGEHIDTIENVDIVFRKQRKLSFSFGAIFFAVTLLIPVFTVWWPWWYEVTFWGGFTANYFVVALLYFVFLWVMAWVYSAMADKLDGQLAHMDIEEQQALELQRIREAAEGEGSGT